MKTLLAFLMLTMGIALTSSAQCGTTAVLSGCVGACGNFYSASYTVQASDIPAGQEVAEFCLAATSNSLCPSHNAFATMRKGLSNRNMTGNLNLGDVLSVKAKAGEVIYITVRTVQASNVVCVWAGETHFSLTK